MIHLTDQGKELGEDGIARDLEGITHGVTAFLVCVQEIVPKLGGVFHARLDVEFDDESDHIVSTETKYTEKDYEEGDVFIFSEDGEILGMARSSGKVIYNHHPISTNTLYTEGFLPGVVCESCGGEKPKDIDYDIFDFRCPVCKERKTYRK